MKYIHIFINGDDEMMEKAGDGGDQATSSSSSSSSSSTSQKMSDWVEIQDLLKKKLITEDDFPWKLPIPRNPSSSSSSSSSSSQEEKEQVLLKYVGGVDVSYSKEDPSIACGTLVVLDLINLQVVYNDSSLVTLHVPYIPGFLAFREAPPLLQLLDKMKTNGSPFYPQLLMVDGNGLLHPRGFGLACHLGVLADIPTIGIGKNLHHVDGLTQTGVRQLLQAKKNGDGDVITLKGSSGHIWGAAVRSTEGSWKPIFISTGHRMSLGTAIRIVKQTCKYRVPETIRQADIRSREHLRNHQMMMLE